MYRLINSNIDILLRGISKKEHIDPYISICTSFEKRENKCPEFKTTYRKFYQLNAARLSNDFCESYFSLLEENREKDEIDIRDITNRLYEIECNKKGTHAVHFSFSSKLAHTLDNRLPVYDSMVAAFYFFPNIKPNWKKGEKIEEYLKSYEFLISEYHRINDESLLKHSMDKFRKQFDVGDEYSNIKIIDTLIWRYTALLKTGAVRDSQVKYG